MLRKMIPLYACLFSILSGILLALSFSNGSLWFFAWFGFVPLFFAIENKSKGKAFMLSYLAGLFFWFGTIYWLIHVTLAGLIVLVFYLALYFGVFGILLNAIRYPLSATLFIPSVWVILEYLRSYLLTGFPWTLLGYSQYKNLAIIQIADITGAWGVSFLLMLTNVAIYRAIIYWSQSQCASLPEGDKVSAQASPKGTKSVRKPPPLRGGQSHKDVGSHLVFIFCLLIVLGYGYYKLSFKPLAMPAQQKIKVSVIQGNIPQESKWNPYATNYVLDKYTRLTEEAVKDSPDLIIWPEAACPEIVGQDSGIFQKILGLSRTTGIPLLIGAVVNENDAYFNSALLLNNGEITGRYDKLHLVPFGEYIPLKKAFPFLETIVPIGDITAGKEYVVFTQNAQHKESNAINFSVLVCFEDLFPELSRRFAQRGAQFLVNITNDAWYKKTSAPYQHFEASVFRAVENRLPLVRAANTGISAFIAPSGEVLSLVGGKKGENIFITGLKTQEICSLRKTTSFYTRHGDIFIMLNLAYLALVLIYIFKERKAGLRRKKIG